MGWRKSYQRIFLRVHSNAANCARARADENKTVFPDISN